VSDKFNKEANKRIDENNISFYASFTAARWLSIRVEFLGYTIVFLSAIFAVIYRGVVSPGIAGLAIGYAFNITKYLNVFVRFASDLETNIVSIERCLEYTDTPTEV
jgi:ABC-type multidrug transport system fused ATPase/permease subunit